MQVRSRALSNLVAPSKANESRGGRVSGTWSQEVRGRPFATGRVGMWARRSKGPHR